VGLASVYRKGALISVPATVEIRAAVGRTPISPPETILAGMCTKFIEEFGAAGLGNAPRGVGGGR
jgi:hypothetical protein